MRYLRCAGSKHWPWCLDEPTTNNRPWLFEEQFASDPTLHATREQTVVLHLEGRRNAANAGRDRGRGAIRRNTFRFLVAEAGDFSFCIPEDEPQIVRLKLKGPMSREKGPMSRGKGRVGTLLVTRDDACEPVTLIPGSHTVEVDHDSRGIPAGGRKAFFHQPQKTRLLGDVQAGFGTPDFIAFRASNGKFVGGTSASQGGVADAVATNVSPSEVWDLAAFNSTNVAAATTYLLAPANGQGVMLTMVNAIGCAFPPTIYVFPQESGCPWLPAPFHINDQGGGEFNLVLDTLGNQTLDFFVIGGVYTDGSETLFYDTNKPFAGETLTLEYKGFDCATPCDDTTLPLATGEIALYAQSDCAGPAMVFNANIADMSIYDSAAAQELAIGNDMVSSIRVGPNTLALLYDEPQFGGNSEGIGADVPCLDVTALGENTTSSFQIKSLGEYLVTTNGCQDCVLTGTDLLSGQDFTGSDFSQSILDGADLTDTIFSGATLEATHFSGAELSGADFSGADLSCAQFDNTDLTGATFNDNNFTEDFSCYLNLIGATLDYTTFPVEDWRFFDLQGSTVDNVPDVVSTTGEPLDLSGAILSGVTWLAGKTLDDTNLGCATGADGDAVCTQLVGTDLSGSSLQQANLEGAVLSGANLNLANLKEANLTGAQLLKSGFTAAATLEGAYLKNATLEQADLTGVSLSHANFYGSSASASGATMTDANFSGAYLSGANFSNALLEGANFEQAVLVNTSFNGANLGTDPVGNPTNLSGAYLQGADFTNVNDVDITNANFPNAYLDLANTGTLFFQLFPENLEFTGCTSVSACSGCVTVDYDNPTIPPSTTGSGNTCPDENSGPCATLAACANQNNQTLQRWECPTIPVDQAQPPSSDSFANLPGTCTTIDFNW